MLLRRSFGEVEWDLAGLKAWSYRCIGFVSCSACRLRDVWRCTFRRLYSPGPFWQTCRSDLDGLINSTGLYPLNSFKAFSKLRGTMELSVCPTKFSVRAHRGTQRLFISEQVPQHLETLFSHSLMCLCTARTVLLNTRERNLQVSQTSTLNTFQNWSRLPAYLQAHCF